MYGGGAAPGVVEPAGGAPLGGAAPADAGGSGGSAPFPDAAPAAAEGGCPALPDAAPAAAAEPAALACGSARPGRSAKKSDPRKPSKTPPQAKVPATVGPFSDGMLAPFLVPS